MIKRAFLVLGVITAIFGCQDIKYPERPDNLIDPQTMVSIYTDSYLANASKRFNRTILLRNGVDLEGYIYKKYNVDSLQYERSNAFYTADIDLYRDLMTQVEAAIEIRLATVDSVLAKEKEAKDRRRDSLRKIALKRRDSLGVSVPDSLLDPGKSRIEILDSISGDTTNLLQGRILQQSAKDSLR